MKIKIIKCDVPHHWYFNLVGEEFEVTDLNELNGTVTVYYDGDEWLVPCGDYKYI